MAYTWKKYQSSTYSKAEKSGFKGLADTGIMRVKDFKNTFGYESFKKLEENKMVETRNVVVDGKKDKIVKLSNTGKKFVKLRIQKELYKYNSKQLSHDLKLSEKYCQLTDKERRTWVHEGVIKDVYKEMGIDKKEDIKTIDACYKNDQGEYVGVEVFTSKYSKKSVQGKMNALKYFTGGQVIASVR